MECPAARASIPPSIDTNPVFPVTIDTAKRPRSDGNCDAGCRVGGDVTRPGGAIGWSRARRVGRDEEFRCGETDRSGATVEDPGRMIVIVTGSGIIDAIG